MKNLAYWAAIIVLWWATRFLVSSLFPRTWVSAQLAAYVMIVAGVGGFLFGRRVGDQEGARRVLDRWYDHVMGDR
jgi:hypothetical protein